MIQYLDNQSMNEMWNCLLIRFIHLMVLMEFIFLSHKKVTDKITVFFCNNKIKSILYVSIFWKKYPLTLTYRILILKSNNSCTELRKNPHTCGTECVKSYLNLQTPVRTAWDWRWSCSVGRTLPQGWGSLPVSSTPSGFQHTAEWQRHQTASPLFHLFVSVAKIWYMIMKYFDLHNEH